MGFNSAFKGLKLLKTSGNGRLNYLNDPVLNALRGRRFISDEGVKEAVHEWLASQPKTFFFLRASRCFCKAGTSVLQNTGTILKNDVIVMPLLLLK